MRINKADENPVDGVTARRHLSARTDANGNAIPLGASRFSALKRAMGLRGRYVMVSECRKYLREHPEFTETLFYPRKPLQATPVYSVGQVLALVDRRTKIIFRFKVSEIGVDGAPVLQFVS